MPDGVAAQGSVTRIGDQTIICRDCLDVMRDWQFGPVDVVVTSPPYNLNLVYGIYDDSKTEEDYVEWLVEAASAVKEILQPDGSFFLNISGSNSRPYVPFLAIARLRQSGFHLQNHITWIKSIGIGSGSTGHFKPVSGRRFMHHNHEHIFHLTLTNQVELDRLAIGIPFQDKSNIARRRHPRDLRCRGNTWFIPYPTVKTKAQKYWHPATFPIELPLWCIYLHGRHPATVLDPFLGTGTSLVAAHFARARGIGIDIDATYIETARKRLTATVKGTLLVRLNAEETAELFRQDAARRDGGGWQSRIVAFQQRLNKTTGELALTEDDVSWIKTYGPRPGDGSWQRSLNAAFSRHIDLSRPE
jgi:site-specific DNA-methyltransferase (adenine-specific)